MTDLVYADDICLMASSPEHLQALIDALAVYCATLTMPWHGDHRGKNKGDGGLQAFCQVTFSGGRCLHMHWLAVEHVDSFTYLGLHLAALPSHCSSESQGSPVLGGGTTTALSAATWQHS